ncbi:winged helix-turn-helix domain-containing protein [Plantibacter sp. CFBP 8804]|uniref:winged helix-turn-helix domain-containing protein n=1 Tax=Plantibacter sp. CFBP 8804 TaxID=2775270 RepID=UPI00178322A3|nr:winged helix-turn-helix domain-containing protein [Plantibacter sp. CFBP 8804]MBD8518620.1 winged helix-turn-helix transcriptional regulator [Plantibacter sp. CFBP 8804]
MSDRSHKSKSSQAAKWLSDRINAGVYAVGDRLPSLRELGDEFGLASVQGLRNAYRDLIDAGTVQARQGSGYFLVRQPSTPGPRISELEDLEANLRSALAVVGRLRSAERRHADAVDALTGLAQHERDFPAVLAQIVTRAVEEAGGLDHVLRGSEESRQTRLVRQLVSGKEELRPHRVEEDHVNLAADALEEASRDLAEVEEDLDFWESWSRMYPEVGSNTVAFWLVERAREMRNFDRDDASH